MPQLYTQVIVLRNDGTIPIRASDFEQPIFFRYGCEKVMRGKLLSAQPATLKPSVTSSRSYIQIDPFLLNPTEQITLGVLTAQHCIPVVEYRIANVQNTAVAWRVSQSGIPYKVWDWPVGLLLLGLAGVLFYVQSNSSAFSNVVMPLVRGWELQVVAVLVAVGAISLLDKGATHHRFYDLLPSTVVRLALGVAWMMVVVLLFRRSRPVAAATLSSDKARSSVTTTKEETRSRRHPKNS